MTKEQAEACEKLTDNPKYNGPAKPYFIAGFQAAQSPEMLMLNPLVKGLVEEIEGWINGYHETFCREECLCAKPNKALAPFKEGE